MKLKKKQINSLKQYFFHFFFIISLMFLIATSNTKDSFVVNNINTVKALESSRIEQIDNKKPNNLVPTFTRISSIQEVNVIPNKKIEFIGTLTGYGPDCVGCSGIVGCPPYQNVKNGNIYYEDSTYGKIRILAADKNIPCGSIVKISNYPYIDGEFYGIVLDRGSSIVGLTMDLLYPNEQETIKIGRTYNINFQITRWGF